MGLYPGGHFMAGVINGGTGISHTGSSAIENASQPGTNVIIAEAVRQIL